MLIKILCIIFGLCGVGYGIYKTKTTKSINTEIENKNAKILALNRELETKINTQKIQLLDLKTTTELEQTKRDNLAKDIATLTELHEHALSNAEQLSQKAFDHYADTLEDQYNQAENDYHYQVELLKDSYSAVQEKLKQAKEEEQKELDKIKATREAVQQAMIREEEIKEQQTFYCLQISDVDKNDITVLNNIKTSLTKPRILSMLIWSTYYQKQLKALSAKVLNSTTPVCGVYKITNQVTGGCYIGQSVDIAKRWSDHAKCGLGIDTPHNNKLYQSMLEYNLWNFSWELLEECPRNQLDEKEKEYIEIYMADTYGFNSTHGNKKKEGK